MFGGFDVGFMASTLSRRIVTVDQLESATFVINSNGMNAPTVGGTVMCQSVVAYRPKKSTLKWLLLNCSHCLSLSDTAEAVNSSEKLSPIDFNCSIDCRISARRDPDQKPNLGKITPKRTSTASLTEQREQEVFKFSLSNKGLKGCAQVPAQPPHSQPKLPNV